MCVCNSAPILLDEYVCFNCVECSGMKATKHPCSLFCDQADLAQFRNNLSDLYDRHIVWKFGHLILEATMQTSLKSLTSAAGAQSYDKSY